MISAAPRLLSCFTLAALLALPLPARADGPLDFTLKNRLGVTISEVYVSPHQTDRWEEDILGENVLPDGRDLRIRFSDQQVARGNIWDLKIKTADNREFVWVNPGFNLRNISEIAIIQQNGKATAIPK